MATTRKPKSKPRRKRQSRPARSQEPDYNESISLHPLTADEVVARLLGVPPPKKTEKP